jgi:ELWxxDGT repeat protein
MRVRVKAGLFSGMVALFALLYAEPVLAAPPAYVPSSDPEDLLVAGDMLFFTAFEAGRGRCLWRLTDAEAKAAPVPLFHGSSYGSEVASLSRLGDRVAVFTLEDDGCSLWVTNGDLEETVLVSARFRTVPSACVEVGNRLFFAAEQAETGKEVWVLDGNLDPPEVRLVDDFAPGPKGSAPFEKGPGVSGSGMLFFSAGLRQDFSRMYAIDRDLRLQKLHRVDVGTGAYTPLGDRVVFNGKVVKDGWELWISDGTRDGTYELKDIYPGDGSSSPTELFAVPGGVLFQAEDGVHGRELWFTDGTEAGTRLVKDLNPGAESGGPYKFCAVGDHVYFNAHHPDAGLELWQADLLGENARMVKDIYPGEGASETYELCAYGDCLVFSAHHPTLGEEIWITDGTEEGTICLRDIHTGRADSSPYSTVEFDGYVFFAATDVEHGRELWRTDGTEEGTQLYQDLFDELIINPSSSPVELTAHGDLLYFVVNDGLHGSELWASDGTKNGTALVADIVPGPQSSDPRELVVYQGKLHFVAMLQDRSGEGIYRVGAGASKPVLLEFPASASAFPGFRELTATTHTLFFSANDGLSGRELWGVRGYAVDVVRDIVPGAGGSNPHSFYVWRDEVYFLADDGIHGEELWRSDGTYEGTDLVSDIALPPVSKGTIHQLIGNQRALFFVANDGSHGDELWSSNGDSSRTRMVRDIRRGAPAVRFNPR